MITFHLPSPRLKKTLYLFCSYAAISCAVVRAAFAPGIQRSSSAVPTFLKAVGEDTRKTFFSKTLGVTSSFVLAQADVFLANPAFADIYEEDFLKTGRVAMPMGVSGQAGKSRPETGIVLRDGTEVSRDTKTGNVLAEVVLDNASTASEDPIAVLVTFTSPWSLAKGSLFDVECRNADTGDSAFLSLSNKANGKSVEELPTTFFTKSLFSPTGRFSFYGQPSDIKVKKSYMNGKNRIIELSFSILSQSTGAEIPRTGIIAATIPEGADEAVMLVASSTALRWSRVTEKDCRKTVESFNVSNSPKTGMKVRAKERNESLIG